MLLEDQDYMRISSKALMAGWDECRDTIEHCTVYVFLPDEVS